ncbi:MULTISPECIES: hypothetical protein [Clostridia]|uniref:anti-sigma-I factor RsgI family protein n=1 Tax=Clostridia TaxID=186801 RepID=UPI00067EDFA0|nr:MULTISPECIES: hypothetical protein [Clostridia]
MKYIVMECNLGYAVVLDREGRFLKVANMHYEVGQTVTEVIEMQAPLPESASAKKKINKWMYTLAAAAACLIIAFTSILQMGQTTCASVYMTINPEIRIDVNRKDVVVGLKEMNEDGKDLINGYDFKKKQLDLVMSELVDRAISMGYLHEGGQIALMLDSDADEWVTGHTDKLKTHLNEHLRGKLNVTIKITDKNSGSQKISIPVEPNGKNNSESNKNEKSPTGKPSTGVAYEDSGYDDGDIDDNESDDDDQNDDDDDQNDDDDDQNDDDDDQNDDDDDQNDDDDNDGLNDSDDGMTSYEYSQSNYGEQDVDNRITDSDDKDIYDNSQSEYELNEDD